MTTIRALLTAVEYMFRDQQRYVGDFKLVVKRARSRQDNQSSDARLGGRRFVRTPETDSFDVTLCLWCLNAAVAFMDVVKNAQSHGLVRGELGTAFPIRLEANHVVNTRDQVLLAAVLHGPGGVDLSATYQNQQDTRYQDALGELLLQYAQSVPGGILVFLPSYALLDNLEKRWNRTGVWMKIEAAKAMFTEPRRAGASFDALLDDYKRTVAECMTIAAASSNSSDVQTGAIFLAVYRGEVSEGIDFANANSRAVLAIGIPYPSPKDLQVTLKRTYQDEQNAVDKTRVSGAAWYELQAFRALNQALGRCIRHRDDYGAIVLLDSRYRFHAHTKSLSKCPCVRLFEHSNDCLPLLAPFFAANAPARGLGILPSKEEQTPHCLAVRKRTRDEPPSPTHRSASLFDLCTARHAAKRARC